MVVVPVWLILVYSRGTVYQYNETFDLEVQETSCRGDLTQFYNLTAVRISPQLPVNTKGGRPPIDV